MAMLTGCFCYSLLVLSTPRYFAHSHPSDIISLRHRRNETKKFKTEEEKEGFRKGPATQNKHRWIDYNLLTGNFAGYIRLSVSKVLRTVVSPSSPRDQTTTTSQVPTPTLPPTALAPPTASKDKPRNSASAAYLLYSMEVVQEREGRVYFYGASC